MATSEHGSVEGVNFVLNTFCQLNNVMIDNFDSGSITIWNILFGRLMWDLCDMVAERDTFSICVSGIAFGFAFWIPTIAFGFAFWIRAFPLSHSDSHVAFWIRLLDENNKH